LEHAVEHSSALIPILVFLVVYAGITFELVNKAAAVLTGVGVLVVLKVTTEHHAVGYIDFETLMLLTGMMIIVSLIKESGFFTIVSVKIAEITKGSPVKILVLFSIVTAVMSAFLDNVTTVLIIIPIIIELTRGMGLDPKNYVLSQAIISNVGGAATLIGDPPNVIIGSKVGLTFNQFVIVLTVLWVSGIISGFLDNIPFTITMIPIIHLMLESNPIPNDILWWALALGACFGGNITMIGASANIVSVGIAKKYGVEISFIDFMKKGIIVTFISLIVASIYLIIFLKVSL